MRKNLKLFRVSRNMTQGEFAFLIGWSRSCYQAIESGDNKGRPQFWADLKKTFQLSDLAIEELKKNVTII